MPAGISALHVGDQAPSFCLPDSENHETCLNEFKGTWVVLYFYPRDNTTGCTREAVEFTNLLDEFKKLNAVVLGVSPDSVESHQKFVKKQKLKITLLSDTEHKILEQYGVWQRKKLYGREFWGVMRSTVLIDPEGRIAQVWPQVQVKGHAEDVKRRLRELQG